MAVYVETRSKQGITSISNKTHPSLSDHAQAAKQEEWEEKTKLGMRFHLSSEVSVFILEA